MRQSPRAGKLLLLLAQLRPDCGSIGQWWGSPCVPHCTTLYHNTRLGSVQGWRGLAVNIITVALNGLTLTMSQLKLLNNWINRSAFRFRLVITDYILHQTLMTFSILLDIQFGDNSESCDWQSLYRDGFLEIPDNHDGFLPCLTVQHIMYCCKLWRGRESEIFYCWVSVCVVKSEN